MIDWGYLMQDVEKSTGRWEGGSDQEAGDNYIIGSFVSLILRLTFFRLSSQGLLVLFKPTEGV